MYQQILLAVALQHWEEFTSHALAAREVAVALAKGSGARLSVLSVYDYGEIKESGLSAELAARFYAPYPETIVAVTGTNGKTSTVELTRQLWRMAGHRSASIGRLTKCQVP